MKITEVSIMSDDTEEEFISSVKELTADLLYCDTRPVYDSAQDQPIPRKLISHCLSLKLLHILGRFDTEDNENGCQTLILLAECVHDVERNVLIGIKLTEESFCEEITFNHICRTFTLKNFKTVASPEFGLSADFCDTNCSTLSKPLYDISILASKKYHSILKFYGEVFENSLINLETEKDVDDSISDISISDLEPTRALANKENFLTEDENSTSDRSRIASSTSSSLSKAINEPVHTLKRKLSSLEIGDGQSENDLTIINTDVNHDNENQDPNDPNKQIAPVEMPLDSPNEIFDKLSDDIRENFDVLPFIEKNSNFVENSNIELTELSELAYPSSPLRPYNFANIIGIVKSTSVNKERITQLIICDEKVHNFTVQLGFLSIGSVLQSTEQFNEKQFFPNTTPIDDYPQLLPGNVVCIRKLCLSSNETNICAHPDQLMYIETHKPYHAIKFPKGKRLFKDEFKRLIELVCLSAKLLVTPTEAKSSLNSSRMCSFSGQMLAKRISAMKADVYLLLPFANPCATYIGTHIAYIMEQIENMALSTSRGMYTREMVEKLIKEKHIISVSLWENHMDVLRSAIPLESFAFFNVHVKEDKLFPGYFQFIQHGGNDYGRRCFYIDNDSILGIFISKATDLFLDKFYDPSFANNLLSNLDDGVRSRLDGTSVRQFYELANDRSEEDPLEKEPFNKKEIYGYQEPKEVHMLKSIVNLDLCKRIETFDEIVLDHENIFFRISARLVDFSLEDKNGAEIQNMAELRRNLLHFVCISKDCHFAASFFTMMPEVAKTIATSKRQRLKCPHCFSPLRPYLRIQLYLQDAADVNLCVMLTSPEAETLIGCSDSQLIYTDPTSTDICTALKYNLKTFCPNRRLYDDSPVKRSSKKANKKAANESEKEQMLSTANPELDWILQCQKTKLNEFICANNPKIYNSHLFDRDSAYQRIFYIRGIIKTD